MFTITTTQGSTPTGAGKVTAKGHGKQRTVPVDHSRSVAQNHGAAVGALLDVLVDDVQRAKMKHPSALSRLHSTPISDGGGKHRWSINL